MKPSRGIVGLLIPQAISHIQNEAVNSGHLKFAIAVIGDREGNFIEHAAGSSSKGTEIARDTIVQIASVTKLITSNAVLQLVE